MRTNAGIILIKELFAIRIHAGRDLFGLIGQQPTLTLVVIVVELIFNASRALQHIGIQFLILKMLKAHKPNERILLIFLLIAKVIRSFRQTLHKITAIVYKRLSGVLLFLIFVSNTFNIGKRYIL